VQSSIHALNTKSCDAEKRIEERIGERLEKRFERWEEEFSNRFKTSKEEKSTVQSKAVDHQVKTLVDIYSLHLI